jgi:hypothetical protein
MNKRYSKMKKYFPSISLGFKKARHLTPLKRQVSAPIYNILYPLNVGLLGNSHIGLYCVYLLVFCTKK